MDFSYSFLESFIWADAWVLIPVLYFIGMFLEQTPKVPEWISPWILTVIGVGFCLINYGLIIQAVVQGILAAGAAVMLKEVIQKPIQAAQNNLNYHHNQGNNPDINQDPGQSYNEESDQEPNQNYNQESDQETNQNHHQEHNSDPDQNNDQKLIQDHYQNEKNNLH